MSIPKEYHSLFENLVEAAVDGSLCLIQSKDRQSGAPRYVLVIADSVHPSLGSGIVLTALGHLVLSGFDDYEEPEGKTDIITGAP